MDVAVLAVDGVADFGLAAVLEAFHTANLLLGELDSAPEPWQVRVVSTGTSVRSGHGQLVPTTPLPELPGDIGLLVVPAVLITDADGLIDLVSSAPSRGVLERISAAERDGAHLAAACTGTFYLAESGVLDGIPATTSWWLGPAFRRRYPRVELDEERILCRAGQVTTAAAVLSHIDLALAVIAAQSPALAELVSRFFLVGDRRVQVAIPELVARGDSLVAAFERWVRDSIAEQFRIADAAAALGVTVRSLQRATQAEIGMSPRDFVNEIRLERATHLLRNTTLTVDAVAARVGYLNPGTLRSLFRRRRRRSLAEVRASPLSWEETLVRR
ncbi:transcriptional regulator GlxA family with amidase domain [Nocardia transvalensis]|uniref:Transcriptional regulator GlxA family with amidase domain n=1 Tax=Nocardia transvalensis TaxID=37333 RepID=A0A7W9PBX0_9NOCA|nr:helix-turn-helix domain-containing protein [Nocardia transvalensis]MBB5912833.1 transcriptional regulator GlxA family with amidase domain [Nocardia transvalensis]